MFEGVLNTPAFRLQLIMFCHHNKHLMGHFEFLHGTRIICLPLNISEKLHWQHLFEKQEEAETHLLRFCLYNTIPTHPEEQHLPFKQTGATTIFYSDTKPVSRHVLIHFADKTHVLVVTVELMWLLLFNLLSFKFVPTPNKSLKFKRFKGSYVNLPAVVQTRHCQSYTAFLLDMRCSKWRRSFF